MAFCFAIHSFANCWVATCFAISSSSDFGGDVVAAAAPPLLPLPPADTGVAATAGDAFEEKGASALRENGEADGVDAALAPVTAGLVLVILGAL